MLGFPSLSFEVQRALLVGPGLSSRLAVHRLLPIPSELELMSCGEITLRLLLFGSSSSTWSVRSSFPVADLEAGEDGGEMPVSTTKRASASSANHSIVRYLFRPQGVIPKSHVFSLINLDKYGITSITLDEAQIVGAITLGPL